MTTLILLLMINYTDDKYLIRAHWRNFCEKHLVADDPYDDEGQE